MLTLRAKTDVCVTCTAKTACYNETDTVPAWSARRADWTINPSRKLRRFESFTCHHVRKEPLICGDVVRGPSVVSGAVSGPIRPSPGVRRRGIQSAGLRRSPAFACRQTGIVSNMAAGPQLPDSVARWPSAEPLSRSTKSTAADARVTVVLITRDRKEQVLRALAHLMDLPERPQLLLVDNASSDDTSDTVRRLFPLVRVTSLSSNLGALARTVGVRQATTPYVAFSDDDSWWHPRSLTLAADYLDDSPRLALLAASIIMEPSGGLDPTCAQMAESPLPRLGDLPGPSVLGFLACGAVVRRRAFLQVGGFHPLDLAAAGWGLAYVKDVIAHHQPQLGPERAGRKRLLVRNALLSSWLRRPARRAAGDTTRLLRRCADRELRGALLDASRRLPAALSDRRPLPKHLENEMRLLEASRELPSLTQRFRSAPP